MIGISEINVKLLYYNLLALCFAFPVAPKLVPFFLVIISLFSVFNFRIEARKQFKSYFPFLLSFAFYFVCILGLFWTSDLTSGLKHLEIKLSFLVIPIIFLNKNLIPQIKINGLYQSFIGGNIIAAIYALLKAAFSYFQEGINHFTYTLLSPNFHPTYLSIYALFCLSLLFYCSESLIKNIILKNATIAFLIFWIFLLSSKINILILLILLVLQLIDAIRTSLNRTKLLGYSALFIIGIATFLYFNSSIIERFKASLTVLKTSKNILNNETESNIARILIWNSAIELVVKHPIIGVGTGDVNNELVKEYEKRSYTGIQEKRLNAHNQYLQTALSTGIPSAVFLIFFLVFPLIKHHFSYSKSFQYFIIIFCVNALVESTLENQAGVVFFIFFYFLLLRSLSNKIELNLIIK